jgi:predicted phosphodiesterase
MVKKKKIDTGLERAELFLKEKPAYLKKSYYNFYIYYNKKYPTLKPPSEDQFKEARKELRKQIYPNTKIIKLKSNNKTLEGSQKIVDYFDNKGKQEAKIIKLNTFDKNNVLVIGDTHEPFCKEGYLEFCQRVQKEYNCGTVVHIGDLVDNHAVSYHESDVDGRSAGDEYKLALEKCELWYKAFPEVLICIGNHDRLPFRKAFTAGLPKNWLKSYQEMFNSPKGWKWDFIHKVNGVIYQHGTGMSGEMASINAARENRTSTVLGHMHTVCNTRFLASYKDLIFGMNVGCGIDHNKYAFAYGKENTRKPVLSCGVVLQGKLPINIPMNL